jgi:S-DNA-T family DNA segregation ATPase FtsK/SpoIIIE
MRLSLINFDILFSKLTHIAIEGYYENRLMSRRPEKQLNKINPDTKNSVLAILLIGLATVLLLASFQQAGPVGKFIYVVISSLLGIGYYLLPLIAILIAILFFLSHQKNIASITFLGAGLLMIAALGFIDVLSSGNGGLIGSAIGILETLFGRWASLVITGTGIIASFLLTINASIKIRPPASAKTEEEKETKIEIKMPAAAETKTEIKTEAEEKTETPETKKKELPKLRTKTAYAIPPLDLLKSSSERPSAGDLRANANIIKRTLDGFGIPVEMGEINIGPKVTRYTLKPAEGVKLSRIMALNQDLALALAAHPIRIEAPIPGKSLVGIEVPNKSAAVVRLGSLLSYEDFKNSGPLAFVLGRDVTGEPIFADIEKMPHLLVAGATGSGKSVLLHTLLAALFYKNSPETLRLILIDPKRVELSVYDGIPHLVTPVITDGKKTIGVFRWAIQEMERRYEALLDAGARDIKSYNKNHQPPLPFLLIVIDELADLMAAYGREIESSIMRLAQMARATGIHLIVSTQRPSVEVITGLIKANITSRIALQVASQVDSRTILDMAGAEKLLGGGDLLFISSELSKPKRIQGAYISEEEINRVAEFVKKHGEAAPADEIALGNTIEAALTSLPAAADLEGLTADEQDDLYEEALKIIKEAKKASASLLQRRLKIGYARAARLLDIMEAKGIIGPADGAKPREVFQHGE